MAITTRDQYLTAKLGAQEIRITKISSRTSVTSSWTSLFDLAGSPGAGTLAGTSTTAGVVPTDADTGFPLIDAFAGGATGYLDVFEYSGTVAGRVRVSDCVWKGGAYNFNAAVTLSAQPSYASRMPGGDYRGTQIWIEAVTAFTGNLTVEVTYTNQDGTAGRTTGAVATGVAPILGRMLQLPLQAGDSGVQKIESVTATVSSAGTFNVLVLRPLATGRVAQAGGGDVFGIEKLDAPRVFADSALFMTIAPDGTATGLPDINLRIING